MAGKEFEVDDYGSFTNAQAQISNYQNSIEVVATKAKNATSVVGDGSVFKGPAAETCAVNLDILNLTLKGAVYRYNKMSSFLGGTKINYQLGDNISKQVVATRIKDLVGMDLSNLPIIAANTAGINMALSKKNPNFITGGTYVNPKADKYQVDFINEILPYALKLYNEKGILPSLTIAQACKESGFGTAKPGDGYNVFGIKASGWNGKTVNARTGEQTASGETYHINANFRDYGSLEEAVHDYGEVLSLDRYDAVRNAKDYKEAAHAVKAGGYATGVNYDNSLIKDYIEPYNLNQWDPK